MLNISTELQKDEELDAFGIKFAVDTNDFFTLNENGEWSTIVNPNPGVQGKLEDAFTFLIRVFGNGADGLSKADLMTINLERKYPPGYSFGAGCTGETSSGQPVELVEASAQVDGAGHSYQFGLRDSRDRYLTLEPGLSGGPSSGPSGVVPSEGPSSGPSGAPSWGSVVTDETKQLWTAYLLEPGQLFTDKPGQDRAGLRSSTNGLWLSASPDGTLGAASGDASDLSLNQQWFIVPSSSNTKVRIQSAGLGFYLTVNSDSDFVDTVDSDFVGNSDSEELEYEIVYCNVLEDVPGNSERNDPGMNDPVMV